MLMNKKLGLVQFEKNILFFIPCFTISCEKRHLVLTFIFGINIENKN